MMGKEIEDVCMGLNDHARLLAEFLASAEDKMFLQGMSEDEEFLAFMKEHYRVGIDHERDLKRLYRRTDGKVLISFKTVFPDPTDGHTRLMVQVVEDGIHFIDIKKRKRQRRLLRWRRSHGE